MQINEHTTENYGEEFDNADYELDDNLFSYIDLKRGWAIPTPHYWELWHSDLQQDLRDMRLIPRKEGSGWIVDLPRESIQPAESNSGYTRHISDVLTEVFSRW